MRDCDRADDYNRLLPPEGLEQEYADGERVIAGAFGRFPGSLGTVIRMDEYGSYLVEHDEGGDRESYPVRDLQASNK